MWRKCTIAEYKSAPPFALLAAFVLTGARQNQRDDGITSRVFVKRVRHNDRGHRARGSEAVHTMKARTKLIPSRFLSHDLKYRKLWTCLLYKQLDLILSETKMNRLRITTSLSFAENQKIASKLQHAFGFAPVFSYKSHEVEIPTLSRLNMSRLKITFHQ